MSGGRSLRSICAALALGASALAGVRAAHAQDVEATAQPRAGADTAPAVLLVTMGQGDAIWERFGHNFLAVPDSTGRMVAYNWGVFDFAAPDFLSRFLLGDTKYWMEGNDLEQVLGYYQRFNRTITVQRLALTPAQVDSLRAFLTWNDRPEHRYYRYDYFRDNCSTRLRDALDRAMGGELRRQTEPRITNVTYRSESVRLTDEDPASQLGIATALGQPGDVPLSAWEAMFVPMRLQEYLRDIRIAGATGDTIPLVAEERVVFQAQRAPERAHAPSFLAELGIPGLLAAGIIVFLARAAARGRRKAGVALAAIGGFWGGVAGTIGLVLLLAWVATRHVHWYRNENLFQFNPLALTLLVLLPVAWRNPRWRPAARTVAVGVAVLSCIGAALKFMPWMTQDNWALIALALPINVALAWAAMTALRTPAVQPGRARRRDEPAPADRRR